MSKAKSEKLPIFPIALSGKLPECSHDVNSVALDSRLIILQIHSHIEFNMSHANQQVHGQDMA